VKTGKKTTPSKEILPRAEIPPRTRSKFPVQLLTPLRRAVTTMQSGDYMIHIFLEKVKEINMPEGLTTVDPMLCVESCGQKVYSQAKDAIGPMAEVIYGEHLFIEPRDLDKTAAEDAKIMLKLVH